MNAWDFRQSFPLLRALFAIFVAMILSLTIDSWYAFGLYRLPAVPEDFWVRVSACAVSLALCIPLWRRHGLLVISGVNLVYFVLDSTKIRAFVLIDNYPSIVSMYPLSMLPDTSSRSKWLVICVAATLLGSVVGQVIGMLLRDRLFPVRSHKLESQ
jgi:hypothetical protein